MKFFKSKSEAFFLVGIAMSTFAVGVFLIYAGVNWYSFGNPLRRLELQTVSCSTNCLSRIVGDDYVILLTSARGVIHVVPFDRPWDYDCSVARLVEERLIPSKLNGNGRFYVLIGMHVDVHRAAYILDWLAENYSGRVYVVVGTADVSRTMIGGCYKVSSGEDLNEPQFVPVCLADLNSLSRFCKLLGNRIVYDVRRLLFGENNFTIFTYECPMEAVRVRP